MKLIKQKDFGSSILERFLPYQDGPQELYVLGDLTQFTGNKKILTVIGSRNLSHYGRIALDTILSGLTGYEIVTVSGLARGCDGYVHEYSLKYKIPTIAIPGSGLDSAVIYPASNKPLAKEILRYGGLLLSEEKPDAKAQNWMFPKRNRLMAQIADLILVIEGHKNSGTQITARLGLEYGCDVSVIPHDIFSRAKDGSNMLLQDGAHLVQSSDDILNILGIPHRQITPVIEFTTREKLLIELIQQGYSTTETLINKSGLPTHEVLETIIWLELRGVVVKRLGKITCII